MNLETITKRGGQDEQCGGPVAGMRIKEASLAVLAVLLVITPVPAADIGGGKQPATADRAAKGVSNAPPQVLAVDIAVPGTPFSVSSYSPLGNYGVAPNISVAGTASNTYDIAWLDAQTKAIRITRVGTNDTVAGEVLAKHTEGTHALLGFARIDTDGSYAVGYSKTTDKNVEFWVTRFDRTGKAIFDERIFGDRSVDELWSKGHPGGGSSARMVYNPRGKQICFYLGHDMKCEDGKRHQAGYIDCIRATGDVKKSRGDGSVAMGNKWFSSHNFDQRLLLDEGTYYTLAHGDAYPRALAFAAWSDTPAMGPKAFEQYFAITGKTGDNATDTQTGGFVALNDGKFGVVFASSIGRTKKRDLCFMKLDKRGKNHLTKWLTQNKEADAVTPRIALRGKNRILVAWEQYSGGSCAVQLLELDYKGGIVTGQTEVKDVRLPPTHDLVSLPNGDIIWAFSRQDRTITVCRIRH